MGSIRARAELIYGPIHMMDRIRGMIVSARNKALVRSAASARFMIQSQVTNLSGRREAIRIGHHTVVRSSLMVFAHGGDIEVGEWCYLGEGSRIWSAATVKIGNRVLISHDVEIHDTVGHATSAWERHEQYKELLATGHQQDLPNVGRAPIVIGDDAWIGFRSTLMKGITIGEGAIVAANSLVLDDVPPWTVVGGVPATEIRKLTPERPICDLQIAGAA